MVRTTIACAWCRRSKIKCLHEGTPPCRNCLKTNRASCVLSGPFEHGKPSKVTRIQRSAPPVSSQTTRIVAQNTGLDIPSPKSYSGDDSLVEKQRHPKEIVLALSPQLVFEVTTVFHQKFPEFAFFHLPTFVNNWKDGDSSWVLIAAMFALCCRFLPASSKPKLLSEDQLALYARIGLQSVLIDPPSLHMVQALLVMAMYEWGSGNDHNAWMNSGTATRMMQSLDTTRPQSSTQDSADEIYKRTFWACVVMDRFIFCGKSQPLALPLDSMKIDMPIGEDEFAFDVSGNINRSYSSCEPFTFNEYYTVLVKGFDIWSQILELIISGGRRKPDMSKAENCPWVTGSPWKTLIDRVAEWRSQQSDRLKFPTTRVAIHVSLGRGEKFAYLNLLYYVCILFLNREYIPFLPIQISEPVGPIDPPLLEGTAPPGRWHDRAKDLFDAANYITLIHQQLELLNSPLYTPFAAFCSFCAGSMNGYVTSFPHMNLNRSLNSAANEELNFLYLGKFKSLWNMGDGWIQTLKRMKNLRLCATQDQTRFSGKSRSDFVTLDESIHDYAGVTPPVRSEAEPPEQPSRSPLRGVTGPGYTAIRDSEETTKNTHEAQNLSDQVASESHTERNLIGNADWSQTWLMWEDQQFLPFDHGGTEFDFDWDLPPF
ncbi:putative fungal-specific transcription factor [Cadophora sp. MPI-SDFR-AT-0126]|nr:putative fungal-specific transcription factor [Leotiomycetes sp. MPI-SDFR-AT-0126]